MVKDGFRVVASEEARAEWDGWLAGFGERGGRQWLAWADDKTGAWKAEFLASFSGGEPDALALALRRRAPLGVATLLWVNAGPVFRRGRGAEDVEALCDFL